jgi:hypothetical protein
MKNEFVWEVKREDATNLGGPMGTEYTTFIETRLFGTKIKAWKYLEKIAKRYDEKLDKKNWKGNKFGQDIRCEIVYIEKVKIN